MTARLKFGVCNEDRYNKAKATVDKKFTNMGNKKPRPVATYEQALGDPNLQRYFLRQRVQINSYYQQGKKESRKKYGDLIRDVKSLLVPYLFSINDYKPNGTYIGKTIAFKDFSVSMGNANKYFINNILNSFKPSTQPSRRTNRIIPFNRQLDAWWLKNKSIHLSKLMGAINGNPKNVLKNAIEYGDLSVLSDKVEDFKNAAKGKRSKKASERGDASQTTSTSSSVNAGSGGGGRGRRGEGNSNMEKEEGS